MAQDTDRETVNPEDLTLTEDLRMFIGGVVGLALIIVPVLLIRKLVKTAEGSSTFQSIEEYLG